MLQSARSFPKVHTDEALYGATDGKAVGTYLEHKFTAYLEEQYSFNPGNSASGIDLPDIEVDLKTTSTRQPQSSCPFSSARQKIYGLGYHLLVFVYEKVDNPEHNTGTLTIKTTIFIDKGRTGDYQTTRGLNEILRREGSNDEDIVAYLQDRNLPVDDVEAAQIARDLWEHPPALGYLTISNALQWRLQYGHALKNAGSVDGIAKLG